MLARGLFQVPAPSSTPPYPEKYGALHSLGRATAGSYNPTKFSEVWAVASRNSLYRILTTSVALGMRLRAKSSSQAPIYVPGVGQRRKACYRELRRISLLSTPVNRPEATLKPLDAS